MKIPPSVESKIRKAVWERGVRVPPEQIWDNLEELDEDPTLGRPAIGSGDGVFVHRFKVIRNPVTMHLWVFYRVKKRPDNSEYVSLVDFGHEFK